MEEILAEKITENEPEPIIITVKVLQIGVKNLNERVYDLEAAKKMISDFNDRKSKHGVFFGELGFPDKFDTTLNRVSHDVLDLWIEENYVYAKIKVLNTPRGNLLRDIMNDKLPIVFRSRAAGTVEEGGIVKVSKLFSFDAINEKDDSFFGII